MSNIIQIYRKEGWELNPNDRTVNSIFRMLIKNNGELRYHIPLQQGLRLLLSVATLLKMLVYDIIFHYNKD